VDAERSLGLFFEPQLQSWASANASVLVTAANWM